MFQPLMTALGTALTTTVLIEVQCHFVRFCSHCVADLWTSSFACETYATCKSDSFVGFRNGSGLQG